MITSILGTGNMGKALVEMLATHLDGNILWGSRNLLEAAKLVEDFQLENVVPCSYAKA